MQERSVREGLTFVAPYDDPHTIAGQGTIGDEILRQVCSTHGGWPCLAHNTHALLSLCRYVKACDFIAGTVFCSRMA